MFFTTEPEIGCRLPFVVDEIWSYTRRTLTCVRQPGAAHRSPVRRVASPAADARASATVFRYVPPGFDESHKRTWGRGIMSVPALDPANMAFMGDPWFSRRARARCWRALTASLGHKLNVTPPIFSMSAMDKWWSFHGDHSVHLSLHKYGISSPLAWAPGSPSASAMCTGPHHCCNDRQEAFESVRAAPLLSRGATLVAAQSYRFDEREYGGLVHFTTLDELPVTFASLAARSPLLAAESARNVSDRFAARFAPPGIFERAEVYRDLLQRVRADGSASGHQHDRVNTGGSVMPCRAASTIQAHTTANQYQWRFS